MRGIRKRQVAQANSSPQESKPVQPNDEYILAAMDYLDNAPVPTDNRYEGKIIDADGNIIYEE